MNIFKHMVENLFVTATGIAALIHSTWSLGTIFSGEQPDPATNMLGFLGWIIPALLIAFALDIGQIFTSAEIRQGDKRLIKYLTFGIFAVATYYLQWLYMVHHIPTLALENGIREEWLPQVTLLRDMAIWIVPAFMPLSTALYTISQKSDVPNELSKVPAVQDTLPPYLSELPIKPEFKELPEPDEHDTKPYEPIVSDSGVVEDLKTSHTYNLECPDCDWTTGDKPNAMSAKKSLTTHQSRYCYAVVAEVE